MSDNKQQYEDDYPNLPKKELLVVMRTDWKSAPENPKAKEEE
jgi:hypothetical protein